MEIGGAALTGLFIGMAWALVKVVEYFLKKYGKEPEVKGLTDVQDKKIGDIHQYCYESERFGTLSSDQKNTISNIEKLIQHLDDLHSVYDENHVPKWYVPQEILSTVRSIRQSVEVMNDDLKEELARLGVGQSVSVEKMSELINSQKLVTERLGDLITLWSKVMKSN